MNTSDLKFFEAVKLFNEEFYWDAIEAFQESLSEDFRSADKAPASNSAERRRQDMSRGESEGGRGRSEARQKLNSICNCHC
jgi:hypothetical protein